MKKSHFFNALLSRFQAPWQRRFLLAFAAYMIETALFLLFFPPADTALRNLVLPPILAILHGEHFCFRARECLPSCYDEEQIDSYRDGSFRLKIPGVSFNNSNWPHIVRCIRVWCITTLILYPPLFFFSVHTFPTLQEHGSFLIYFLFLMGSFFLPLSFIGRKYE